MKPTDLFSDFQNRVSEALRNSPAADIEKNVRAWKTSKRAWPRWKHNSSLPLPRTSNPPPGVAAGAHLC